jgi:RNAse (barnase) inhibitor barstar
VLRNDARGSPDTIAPVPVVAIPVSEIDDWESFHSVFQRELGFPAFYGRNMNAWIDCLISADE